LVEIHKEFDYSQLKKPYRYNIWNIEEKDQETNCFGVFPKIYMKNLLFYHTEILDIVYDPFAGYGYYCSDLNVRAGREDDIYEWDIANGRPNNLPKPKLVFLDPPYWIQAENQYSKKENDLGNMSLDNFLNILIEWKVEKIAIVIQPTQYKNNMVWEDHTAKFITLLNDNYDIEMRYNLPYLTEQYNPQMLEKGKEEHKALSLFRDLIVWRKK